MTSGYDALRNLYIRLPGGLRDRIRPLRTAVRRRIVQWTIDRKWRADRRSLPLVADHRALYDRIHHFCMEAVGSFPDLRECRDFNDRIQWLKLFDQSEEVVRCADKVRVRDYVRERAGNECLLQLFQVHEHFSQIDFHSLPDAFVIKTNHDCGTVILVRDKASLDRIAAKATIEAALKRRYGWEYGEWAYSHMEPKVLVEEFIDPDGDSHPADYKFHCVDGRVRWLQYIYDRFGEPKEAIVEPDGSLPGFHLDPNLRSTRDFTLPRRWNDLKTLAETLAAGWKYVRVDLYCNRDRIFFGEMTFFPYGGAYREEGQRILGQRLDFDRNTFKPPLASRDPNPKRGRGRR